jgi:hypothetical protein
LHRRRRRPRPAPSGALSQSLSRAESNREILRRRRAGQTLQSIGDASGLTRERVRQITEELDPGINLRRRAAEAARTHWTCPSCGKRVRWAAAMRCGACTPDRRRWTEARIVEAMLAFRVATGRWPRTSDWSPALARRFVREQAARLRRYQDGDWPSTRTVTTRFGRW